MKQIIFIVFFLTFCLKINGQLKQKNIAYTNNIERLYKMKGFWEVSSLKINQSEIDCQNFDKSFKEQLLLRKTDSTMLRFELETICFNAKMTKIEIQNRYFVTHFKSFDNIVSRDTILIQLNKDLENNKIIINTEPEENLIFEIQNSSFIIKSNKNWMKYKRIKNGK